MWKFRKRTFELPDELTCWNEGMGNCFDYPGLLIATEEQQLVVPTPDGEWEVHSFETGQQAERVVLPKHPKRKRLIPTVFSASSGRGMVSTRPFPTAVTAEFSSGSDPSDVWLWNARAKTLDKVVLDLSTLVEPRRHAYDADTILSGFVDSAGAAWLVVSARRMDHCSLLLMRNRSFESPFLDGVRLASATAGAGFAEQGWGFVRFVEELERIHLIVGRSTGKEDRIYSVAREANLAEASAHQFPANLRSDRILDRLGESWIVAGELANQWQLVVARGATVERQWAISERVGLLERVGPWVLSFDQSQPIVERLDPSDAESCWEEVDGAETLEAVQSQWRSAMDDLQMLPPFPGPMPVRCGARPGLFLLGLRDQGFEGIVLDLVETTS